MVGRKAHKLSITDFVGADFDVDKFVEHVIGPRLSTSDGNNALSDDVFDPESVLEALDATKTEVDKLRDDADQRVQAAVDRVDTLSERYVRDVKSLQKEADQVLHGVHGLQGTVGSMGAKTVTMGRRLDKMDQERRRAVDAAKAIRKYEVLCGEDEEEAARAIKALIPDGKSARMAETRGSEETRGSQLMDAALMLRKLQVLHRFSRVLRMCPVCAGAHTCHGCSLCVSCCAPKALPV